MVAVVALAVEVAVEGNVEFVVMGHVAYEVFAHVR